MSNKAKEYQVVAIFAGAVYLKTDYRPLSDGDADLWFRKIVEALKGVEGVNIALFSREGSAEQKLEQKFEGDA